MTDTVQEVRQAGSRSDEQKVSGVELHMALIQHMADIAHMVDTQHMAHIAGTVGMAHGVHRGTKGARTDRKPGHTWKILHVSLSSHLFHAEVHTFRPRMHAQSSCITLQELLESC